MARCLQLLSVLALVVLVVACGCPKCAVDSQDGVGVSYLKRLVPAEKAAVASVMQLLTAHAGPDNAEVRALDSALSEGQLVAGVFNTPPKSQIRGYVQMKDGLIALDDSFLRAAPRDAAYLSDPRTWPFVPILFAAGHRLARGGTWSDSIEAARVCVADLASALEGGKLKEALPEHTDPQSLARALRYWRENF